MSTYASNFAINLTNNTDMSRDPQGSDRNAIRHTLWQAMITQKFGKETANDAGLAHEGLTMPEVSISNSAEFISPSLEDADSWADMLNNLIGQEIGANNPDISNKNLAASVLKEFFKNGLWTVEETEDGFKIQKTKIADKELQGASDILQTLHSYGLKKAREETKIERFGEM